MNTPAEIWEAIKGVFMPMPEWVGIVALVVGAIMFSVVVYMVLKTLWENNAKRYIFAYLLFVLADAFLALFTKAFSVTVFLLVFLIMSLFLLFLFHVELKRGIWNATKRLPKTASSVTTAKTTAVAVRADEYITGIIKAVQNLSKNDVGALIVLSNGNLPKEIIESGVTLNAKISSQLIEGIFVPKAPLHDGAMVIFGDQIQAAGCFLPLTQRDFPKEYGTRHRAGIGVTEVADVSTIIVSEETGIVSVVKRGEISRYVDSEGLKRFLKDYYWKEFNAEGKK